MPTNDLELQSEVLKKRLDTLIELYDLVDNVHTEVTGILQRQYGPTWSTVAPASEFSSQYRRLLLEVTTNLRALQRQIDTFRTALKDTESDLVAHDDEVRDLFTTLDQKLHPTPVQGPYTPYGPPAPSPTANTYS